MCTTEDGGGICPFATSSVSTFIIWQMYSMRREIRKYTVSSNCYKVYLHVYLLNLFFALGAGHPSLPGSLLFQSKFKTKLENPLSTNTSHFLDWNLILVVLQGKTRLPLQILTGASKKTKSGRIPSHCRVRPTATVRKPSVQTRKTKS